ncbi:MAG: hypothetical protein DMG50_21250 [Acidobacteria bacterium]|nr:MAG: hypothetical protein DMG50_21250 [Acidobacteriota bacterium]
MFYALVPSNDAAAPHHTSDLPPGSWLGNDTYSLESAVDLGQSSFSKEWFLQNCHQSFLVGHASVQTTEPWLPQRGYSHPIVSQNQTKSGGGKNARLHFKSKKVEMPLKPLRYKQLRRYENPATGPQ